MAASASNFVHVVQQYPCLYNNKLPEYLRKDVTDKAWSEVAQKTNTSGKLSFLFNSLLTRTFYWQKIVLGVKSNHLITKA